MECVYCKEPVLRRTQANRTASSRVPTPRGDVHARCLAYLLIDLGLEAAFGSLSEREKAIAVARFRLPSAEEDRDEGRIRYRKVHDAAAAAGSYAPEVTSKTEELLARMRSRVAGSDRAHEVAAEARLHLQRAAELLVELP